jgi:hypothetical protein
MRSLVSDDNTTSIHIQRLDNKRKGSDLLTAKSMSNSAGCGAYLRHGRQKLFSKPTLRKTKDTNSFIMASGSLSLL